MLCSPFSLNAPSPRRVSFHLFQSFFRIPSSLYTTLYLQGAVHFLLAFYTQTDGALFLYAPNITCICHIALIPLSFSMLLFLSFALVMRILMMFSWGQCCISTSQSLPHYIAWVFHFEAPSLPNFVAYSFFALQSRCFFSFLSFYPFSVTFFGNNYTFFIK